MKRKLKKKDNIKWHNLSMKDRGGRGLIAKG